MPMTRLARYPLLLEAVFEHTPDECSDRHNIPKVLTLICGFRSETSREAGRAENTSRVNLLQLEQQLLFRPDDHVVSTSNE